MKKVVNGRVYDTDTASTVLSWKVDQCVAGLKVSVQYRLNRAYQLKDGVSPEDAVRLTSWGSTSVDPDRIDKTRGEFFISAETSGWDEESKVIKPISDDEAKLLVEKRASFDEYVKWFGDPRGLILTPDAVRKAVDARSAKAYDDERALRAERDAAQARVHELESRVREFEAIRENEAKIAGYALQA